jgi:hypothetical protein
MRLENPVQEWILWWLLARQREGVPVKVLALQQASAEIYQSDIVELYRSGLIQIEKMDEWMRKGEPRGAIPIDSLIVITDKGRELIS